MHVSDQGVAMVARFEGFRSMPYRDLGGVWTIGYGETSPAILTRYKDGIAQAVALRLLRERLDRDYAPAVRSLNRFYLLRLKRKLPQEAFDALVSFVYNVGVGALLADTGVRRELRRRHFEHAVTELKRWDKVAGRPVAGLTNRRALEAEHLMAGIRRQRLEARAARRRRRRGR